MLHSIILGMSGIPISPILTITMFALLAISVLIGMLRGVKKSFFYTIFYLIALIVFFLSLNKMTEIILNSSTETVLTSLRNLLGSFNGANLDNMFVKGTESYTLVMSILGFVVQLLLCIGFTFFYEVIYKLLVWLFWILIGKRFAPKKKKVRGKIIRIKRQRLAGACIGIIPGIISVFMLFIPISGIFSVASSFTRVEKNEGISFGTLLNEEDYKLFKQAVGSYEESVPGKIFNMVSSKDGRSIDLWLCDRLITVNIDDRQYNIRHDIENIGEFTSAILSTGISEVIFDDNLTSYDLINVVEENEEIIQNAFEAFGNIEIIDLVLNTGIEYLDNSRLVDDMLELETDSINYENLSHLDWSKELTQIGNIFISAVDVLKALPDSSLNSPVVDLESINMDVINNDMVLENFVDELFKSTLINEASVAGLKYALGMEQVSTIVGEVKADDLKEIDVKDDLLNVISAFKSVLNIGINNFTEINLQTLSNESKELKNIIDELLSLELFKVVEDHVLDYAITNYVEGNENIVKYVDIDELKKLGLEDLKIELGSIIETFGRLGEETKLFDLTFVEDEEAYVNYEAIDSKVLRIVTDNIDKSETIQKFMNKAMEGVLVPNVFENIDEYNDMLTKDGFAWDDELYTFANILEAIEKNDTNFRIYNSLTADEFEITLGMLRGISAHNALNEDSYYIDESILVRDVLTKVLDKQASEDDMFSDIFNDDTLSYGKEIETLVKMMVEGNIVEDRNDYVIEFETLSDKFTNLNEDMLHALTNNIEDSKLIQKVLVKSLRGQLSDPLVDDMENWGDTEGRWHDEFEALTNIIIDGEMTDENGELNIEDIGNNFDEISYPQLDAVYMNIDNSLIIQDVLNTALEDSFEIPEDVVWKNEVKVIRDIVKSETYQYEENGELVWSKMAISEISELSCIRPETLKVISYDIETSDIIKTALKDPLKDLLKNEDDSIDDEVNPDNWTNEQWKKELLSISYVAEPLASRNNEKELKGYPADRVYIDINNLGSSLEDEVRLDVLSNLLGAKEEPIDSISLFFRRVFRVRSTTIDNDFGINHSTILRKMFKDALEGSINVDDTTSSDYKYNVDFDSFTNEDYYYEVEALVAAIEDAGLSTEKVNPDDGKTYKYIEINNLADKFNKITKDLINALTTHVNDSIILKKQFQKNLEPTLGEEFTYTEMNTWNDEKWFNEMEALNDVVYTLEEDEDGAIELEIEDKIRVETISSICDNHNSSIIRELMTDPLNDNSSDKVNVETWNDEQWEGELKAIDLLSNEISDGGYIDFNNIDFKNDEDETEVKLSLISTLASTIHTSSFIQDKLYDSLFTDEDYVDEYPTIAYSNVENQWNDELMALHDTVVGTDYVEDGYLYPDNLDFEGGMDIKALENISNNIHKSTLLQSKVYESLFESEPNKEKLPTVNYSITKNRWNEELGALYDVINGTSYVVDDKVDPDNIDFDAGIDMEAFKNIKNQIHRSVYLQNKLYDSLFEGSVYEEKYPEVNYSEEPNRWNEELGSLYYVIDGTTYVNADNKVDPNNIDFDAGIDMLALEHIGEIIHTSIYLQEKIKSALFNETDYEAKYPEVNYSSTQNRWNKEITSLYNVLDGTSYVSDGMVDPNGIDFNAGIDMKALKQIGENVHTSVYLQIKLETALFTDANYTSKYPVVNYSETLNRWNDEITTLHDVLSGTSYVNAGMVDPNAIDFDAGIDMKALYNISVHVHTSTYLQSKLDTSLFNEAGYEAKYPEVNYSSTQNRWNKEIGSLYNVLNNTSYVDSNGMVNPNGIDFNAGIDMKALENISNNIHTSVYLQIKLEAALFTDANYTSKYPVVNYSETVNQWNDEVEALFDVVSGTSYVSEGKIKPNDIDFNNAIDMDALYNISVHIHKSSYIQSKLENPLFGDSSYKLSTPKVHPEVNYSTSINQWNEEVNALYCVINDTSFDVDNKFTLDNVDFENNIEMKVLENIGSYINLSTYLQVKLEAALFNDVNFKGVPGVYPKVKFDTNENQWNEEIKALYNVINNTDYVVGGKFNPSGIDFNAGIKIEAFENISNNIHKSTYIQIKLDGSLFNDVNYQDVYPEVKYSENTNQWNAEIKALYNVINGTTYVNSDNEFDPSSLNFNGSINASLLGNIAPNIKNSTYLQSKLESALEDLVEDDPSNVDTYLLDRNDIGLEYGLDYDASKGTYKFDMVVNFGDINGAWTTELSTIFGIVLDTNSGLINSSNELELSSVESGLNSLSINLITIASDKLDEHKHSTYGSSKIVKLNLVKPLELLATGINGSGVGITHESTAFDWVDNGAEESDLHDVTNFFEILGVESQNEALNVLTSLGMGSLSIEKILQIKNLASYSYYIGALCANHGLSI